MMRRTVRNLSLRRAATVLLLAGCALAGLSGVARAQQVADDEEGPGTASRPVVQPTGGNSGSQNLNAALSRLARDPRNLTALIDAGNAALQLGDTDAAVGFFTRADQVAPGNGQVKAQIGAAMLRSDNPFEALRYFGDAEKAGADTVAMAADRGLAYDLIGDNANAQRQYQLALSRGANDEATRRYALSLAIAGDRRGAEAVLGPLVQRQERAAWRVRTFIMAIGGSPDEAVAIAYASMPQDLAAGIAPYLRYMPRLTAAQQAAAANLGRFPRAADIGRDDARVVEYAALHPRAPRVDSGLIPAGATLGGRGRQDDAASRAKRRRPGGNDPVQVAVSDTRTAPPMLVPPAPPSSPPPVQATPEHGASGGMTGWGVPAERQDQTGAKVPAKVAVASPAPGFASVAASAPPAPVVTPRPASANAGFDLARVQGSALSAAAVPPPAPTAPITPVAEPARPAVDAARVPAPVTQPPVAQPTVLSRLDLPPGAPPPARPVIPAVKPSAPAVEAAPAQGDFSSLFEGFRAPEEEQQGSVAAVDITRITPVHKRPAAPKVTPPEVEAPPVAAARSATDTKAVKGKDAKDAKEAKGSKDAKGTKEAKDSADAKGKDARGERPGGPTSVSRTSERELKGSKEAKDGKDAKAGKGAKAAKAVPSHPSRIWVQVLTGSNRDVMDKEWRRLVREASALKGKKPFITPWRNNFRLLTGPFESDAAAQDFLKALRKDDVSGFEWTSPAGQAVDTLQLK